MLDLLMLLNSVSLTENDMSKYINKERKAPVAEDAELKKRATARAKELCDKKQWSHAGWNNNFKGLGYKHYGENLAKGFSSDKAAHKKLMASPTHKANILNPNFKKVGIAKQKCGKDELIVQLFGG